MTPTPTATQKKSDENEPHLQENAITWELIAEASKGETPAVCEMILKRFDQLDSALPLPGAPGAETLVEADNHAEASGGKLKPKTNASAPQMNSAYLSYPPQDIKQLLKTVRVHHMLKGYDMDIPEELLEVMGVRDKKEKRGKRDKKGKGQKKEKGVVQSGSGGGDPTSKLSSRDRIRQQQVRTLADRAGGFFDKATRTVLRSDFHCQVTEVIVLYYLFVSHYSLREKVVQTFVDAVFSLRDALTSFRHQTHSAVVQITELFLKHVAPMFPWSTFLQRFTHVLIKTHFKRRFQKALKPFPEQDALVQQVHRHPDSLFVLPWGVGTGKTAMLPPLATHYYRSEGKQTLYCVPFGPVRDQSAALLYRCGIPFAYVVKSSSGAMAEEWELQPSYHCGNGKQPMVLIVDPLFVRYYTIYWQQFELLASDGTAETDLSLDARENPPDIFLPTKKRRYSHLNHGLWNPRWTLILDEPCEENENVRWLLYNLPSSAFVMSATSWELVDDSVQAKYADTHDQTCVTIPANTIGVSTTLVGYWLDGDPILSPFHGVQSKQEFEAKLAYVRDKVLWKRFLSAEVLFDWAVRIRKVVPDMKLSVAFDLSAVTFDSICGRVLEYCDTFVDHPSLDDAFYKTFFGFGAQKHLPASACGEPPHPLLHLLTAESARFLGGCIVGTPTVKATYTTMQPLLAGFPSLDDMQKCIDTHRKSIASQIAVLNKQPVTKRDDLMKRQEKFREIESKKRTKTCPLPTSSL